MNEWIEVFRAGKYPQGSFTPEDVERIAKSYDPEYHEAPLVVGHPEHDSPAYGWVEALKCVGGVLLAKFKQVVPEFLELLKKGIYKKRSIRLEKTPEKGWYLRHIGFLGGAAPQVKGLKPVGFTEGGVDVEFELDETSSVDTTVLATPEDVASPTATVELEWDRDAAAARIFDKLGVDGLKKACGWFDSEKPELKGSYKLLHHDVVDGQLKVLWRGVAAAAGAIQGARTEVDIPEADLAAVKRHIAYHYRQFDKPVPWEAKTTQTGVQGGDVQMPEDKAKELEEKLRKQTELQQGFAKKLDEREKEVASLRNQLRRMQFSDFLNEQGSKLPPALKVGVIEFMESLSEEETVEFTAGKDTKKVSPLDFFKDYLKKLPEVAIFEELAKGQAAEESDKREQLIKEYMEKNKADYEQAVVAVAKEHPELFKEE